MDENVDDDEKKVKWLANEPPSMDFEYRKNQLNSNKNSGIIFGEKFLYLINYAKINLIPFNFLF